MKILILLPAFLPSKMFMGPINTTLSIASSLRESGGAEIEILTTDFLSRGNVLKSDKTVSSERDRNGILITKVSSLFLYGNSSVSFSYVSELARRLKAYPVVMVVGTFEFTSVIGMLIASFRNKKIIWNTTGALLLDQLKKKSSLKKRISITLYRWFIKKEKTTILAKCPSEAKDIRLHFPGAQVVVIPNSVPHWVGKPQPLSVSKAPKILYSGRISKQKKLDLLITTLAVLSHRNWECKICGVPQDTKYLNYLHKLVEKFDLKKNIQIVESLEHDALSLEYGSTDIFVLPSHSENFGLAALEAAAAGAMPVVSSHVGFGEVTGGYDATLVRRFNSAKELKATLESLMSMVPELRCTSIERADKIRGLFSRERELEQFRSILGGE